MPTRNKNDILNELYQHALVLGHEHPICTLMGEFVDAVLEESKPPVYIANGYDITRQLDDLADASTANMNDKIYAIKKVREWTKAGLKEAKELVESHPLWKPL